MKSLQLLLLVIICSSSSKLKSQNRLGMEIRTSRNITYNSSMIVGGGRSLVYDITKEENLTTASYSFGVVYKTGLRSTLKLHVGRHRNGRVLDLTVFSDDFSFGMHQNASASYDYLQLTPSFSYELIRKKFIVPIELGIAINKRIKEENIFFVGINEYNYDLRLSSGIQYELGDFVFSGNFIFSKSISGYQNDILVSGSYNPYQMGIEFGLSYFFKKNKMEVE